MVIFTNIYDEDTKNVADKNGTDLDVASSQAAFPSTSDRLSLAAVNALETVEGAKGTGGIATHVERKSRYLVAAKLVDKKAATMNAQSIKFFWKIPQVMRQTLTVDNGKEFSQFKELESKTGLKVYFADPYAAWQRGTNENTNGLLRHYFPKGINFQTVSEEELDQIVKKVNHRPRKCLDYRTPHEVFNQASSGALTM